MRVSQGSRSRTRVQACAVRSLSDRIAGREHSRVTSYSRQDVLRILQISCHQLQGWERAGLISPQQIYTFQDLGQLRTLRALRQEAVPAASIRHSIVAMKAVAGMANPLLEACLVRTGTRLVFRHCGAMVDPIRRQLLFDFERLERMGRAGRPSAGFEPSPLRRLGPASPRGVQDRFLAAVQAEEAGDKNRAIEIYEEILKADPEYAAAYINLGTILFHQRNFTLAEELYRRATKVDPAYVLAFFDLGNVLDELQRPDESIAAYRQAVALSPRYADAHYNLALAFERKGERRKALRHWQAYIKLDRTGPWAEHARGQIRRLLSQEKICIARRAKGYVPPGKGMAALRLIDAGARLTAEQR
jgi:tetratricopeptide (TPR) repeat protein